MPGVYGPELANGDHRLVIGVPGAGKTYFARKLVSRAHRVIYFDPTGEYEAVRRAIIVDPPDIPVEGLRTEKFFRLVVKAGRSDERDVNEEFVFVAQCARAITRCVLLADEVGDYNRGRAETSLKRLHRNGHKQGVVTIFVSQRAVDIPLGCRATATRVDSFLQDNEDDLRALHEIYDPGSPGFADRARAWDAYDPPVTWQRRSLYNKDRKGL